MRLHNYTTRMFSNSPAGVFYRQCRVNIVSESSSNYAWRRARVGSATTPSTPAGNTPGLSDRMQPYRHRSSTRRCWSARVRLMVPGTLSRSTTGRPLAAPSPGQSRIAFLNSHWCTPDIACRHSRAILVQQKCPPASSHARKVTSPLPAHTKEIPRPNRPGEIALGGAAGN